MLDGRLLDKHAHCVETLRDFSDPAVLLQSGESRRNGLIQRLCRDIDGVLDVFEIGYGNFARSEHYAGKDSIFAFSSSMPTYELNRLGLSQGAKRLRVIRA